MNGDYLGYGREAKTGGYVCKFFSFLIRTQWGDVGLVRYGNYILQLAYFEKIQSSVGAANG
jgi:hypothetical protein